MNADEMRKLDELAGMAFTSSRHSDALKRVMEAYALGRRAGMTEAAGICARHIAECAKYGDASAKRTSATLHDEIEKARDA